MIGTTITLDDPEAEAILSERTHGDPALLSKEFAARLKKQRVMEDIAISLEEFKRGESVDIQEAFEMAKARGRADR